VLAQDNLPFVPFLPWIPQALERHECAKLLAGELRGTILKKLDVLAMSSLLPVFEIRQWLPAPIIRRYRRAMPVLERTPVIRRFGVSTFVLAQRPIESGSMK
jgi:hypothetical protein